MVGIVAERSGLKRAGLVLVTREEAGFRFDDYDEPRPVDEPADHQFVHISVTNPKNFKTDAAHARFVEAIGISRFPNTGCSYNRLIFQSGATFEGQPIGRRGAHTVNDFRRSTCRTSGCPSRGGSLTAPSWNLNVNARAYVICQNVGDVVTKAQKKSLARCLAADRLAGFVKRNAGLHGHRCVAGKECPGDEMWEVMQEVEDLMLGYLRRGTVAETSEDDVALDSDDKAWLLATLDQKLGLGGERSNVPRAVMGPAAYYQGRNPSTGVAMPPWDVWNATYAHVYRILIEVIAVRQIVGGDTVDEAAIAGQVIEVLKSTLGPQIGEIVREAVENADELNADEISTLVVQKFIGQLTAQPDAE